METPVVHLSVEDEETVYTPSEDSFLLIDTLEADLETLKAMKPLICIEIGSGSGVVITALAAALCKYQKAYFLATDINLNACKVTKKTGMFNVVNINVAHMDLVNCIRAKDMFDIIIFNPPYVVTESLEVSDKRLVSKTWAGGLYGREVMERVFAYIPKLLSATGFFYLVVVKENDPNYIIKIFRSMRIKGKVVAERKIRGEHLYVLRFEKECTK